ncbi:set domain-containing protein 5 [Colletotrichum kahawae]|uniref:Set domain-containing protein 5 n=1 Tax=Colletotrichum kahawae TaxID=34407 RepID=A0AAE0D5F1_COLKA|nr:set domain-containing protein 5 [Colletotrichum kahawae]
MTDWDDQLAHFNCIPWRSYAHKGHAFEFFPATMNTTAFIPNFIAFMHPLTVGFEAADDAYNAQTEDLDKHLLESHFTKKVSFLLSLGHGLDDVSRGLLPRRCSDDHL